MMILMKRRWQLFLIFYHTYTFLFARFCFLDWTRVIFKKIFVLYLSDTFLLQLEIIFIVYLLIVFHNHNNLLLCFKVEKLYDPVRVYCSKHLNKCLIVFFPMELDWIASESRRNDCFTSGGFSSSNNDRKTFPGPNTRYVTLG